MNIVFLREFKKEFYYVKNRVVRGGRLIKKKCGIISFAASVFSGFLAVSAPAMAASCSGNNCFFDDFGPENYNAIDGNYGPKTVVTNGHINITGASDMGNYGGYTIFGYSLLELVDKGYAVITDGPDIHNEKNIIFGTATLGQQYYDQELGRNNTIKVYDNNNLFDMAAFSNNNSYRTDTRYFDAYGPDGANFGTGYLHSTLAVADGQDARLTFSKNISLKGAKYQGYPTFGVKQTNFFEARNGGRIVVPGGVNVVAQISPNHTAYARGDYKTGFPFERAVQRYAGDFTPVITVAGKEKVLAKQSVYDIASLKAYNSYLQSLVSNNQLGDNQEEVQKNYDKLFAAAYENIPVKGYQTHFFQPGMGYVDDNNYYAQLTGNRTMLAAFGANSSIVVEAGATVDADGDVYGVGLHDGAVGENYGTIRNQYERGVGVFSGSTFSNYGLIDARSTWETPTIEVNGANSIFVNETNGTIVDGFNNNTRVTSALSNIVVTDGGAFKNKGLINYAFYQADPLVKNVLQSIAIQNGSFENSGMIYLGRALDATGFDKTKDVPFYTGGYLIGSHGKNVGTPSVDGVKNPSGSVTIVNTGDIMIGSLTQDVSAIKAFDAEDPVFITNAGNITMRSALNGSPLASYGIRSENHNSQSVVKNTGTINLEGLNNYGLAAANGAAVENAGVINVHSSGARKGLNNIGLLAEGDNSRVVNNGTINLNGVGAIGAYAKDGGNVRVSKTGSVLFDGKSNYQTGYLVSGTNANIDIDSRMVDVSSPLSTGVRVQGGANFVNNNTTLKVTGAGSTGYYVSGNGKTLDNPNFALDHVDVTSVADNGTAFVVEGGGNAVVGADTTMTLSGANSRGVVVDGYAYDFDGSRMTTTPVSTVMKTSAKIDAREASVGYDIKNEGRLEMEKGSLNLGTGTAVKLSNGGHLAVSDAASIDSNGIGVDVSGAGSTIQLADKSYIKSTGTAGVYMHDGASFTMSGDANIYATNGANGVVLGNGADSMKFVAGDTGRIIVTGGGRGIENAAEVENFGLENARVSVAAGQDGKSIGIRTGVSLRQKNSGNIVVDGDNAIGLLFADNKLNKTSGSMDMRDSADLVFNVRGKGSNGIVANTAAAEIYTGASVNVLSDDGGAALVVAGDTRKVHQSGNLKSNSAVDLLDLSENVSYLENSGTLQSTRDVLNRRQDGFSFVNTTDELGHSGNVSGGVNIAGNGNYIENSGNAEMGDIAVSGRNTTVRLADNSRIGTIYAQNSIDNSINVDHFNGTVGGLVGGLGVDNVNLRSSRYIVTNGAAFDNIERVNVDDGSDFVLNRGVRLGNNADDVAGTGIYVNGGSVSVDVADDYFFNNRLFGNGKMNISTAGHTFTFTHNVGTAFAGDITFKNSRFDLSDQTAANNEVVANSTLIAGEGAHITARDGLHNLKGLTFAGGTVDVGAIRPDRDAYHSEGYFAVDKIDTRLGGTLVAGLASVIDADSHKDKYPNSLNILEQDENETLATIATANEFVGSGMEIGLGGNGDNKLGDAYDTRSDLTQAGDVVASADYGYRFINHSGDQKGLFLGYGLKKVTINDGKTLVLAKDSDAQKDNDLSAKVSGNGTLQIGRGDEKFNNYITLSNSQNDIRGRINVATNNTLGMKNDNVLGNTAGLTLANDATFLANGFNQANAGHLIMNDGSRFVLGTANDVDKNGGHFTFSGADVTNGTIYASGGKMDFNGPVNANDAKWQFDRASVAFNGILNDTNGVVAMKNGNIVFGDNSKARLLGTKLAGNGHIEASGDVFIKAKNNDFAGNGTVTKNGKMLVGDVAALGSAVIDNAGVFGFNFDETGRGGIFRNQLVGNGTIAAYSTVNDFTTVTIASDNRALKGNWDIHDNVRIAVDGVDKIGSGSVKLNGSGTLAAFVAHDWDFTTTIGGNGVLEKAGNGRLTVAGDNLGGFAGTARILDGDLLLNGVAKNTDFVVAGGRLTGTGNAGSVTVENGGVFKPGPTDAAYYGTFAVSKDLTFKDGSTYAVAIKDFADPDQFDMRQNNPLEAGVVNVYGKTTISNNSVIDVTRPENIYKAGMEWRVIHSVGGINGRFGSIEHDDVPFLDMGQKVVNNDLYLWMTRNSTKFCDVGGLTHNQCATGNGLDSHPGGSDLDLALGGLSTAETGDALDNLSGEAFASNMAVMANDASLLRSAIFDRFNGFDDYENDLDNNWWGHAVGSNTKFSGHNVADIKRDLAGFVTGIDGEVADGTVLGIMGGWWNTSADINERRNTNIDGNYGHVGIYGHKYWNNFMLTGGATASFGDMDSVRRVNITGKHSIGYRDHLEGDFNTQTYQLFGSIAYNYMATDNLSLQPFADMAIVRVKQGSFTENGKDAALTIDDTGNTTLFTTLGVGGRYDLSSFWSWRPVDLFGSVGYRFAGMDTSTSVKARFAGGDYYRLKGVDIDDTAVVNLGGRLKYSDDTDFSLQYEGSYSDSSRENTLKIKFNHKF